MARRKCTCLRVGVALAIVLSVLALILTVSVAWSWVRYDGSGPFPQPMGAVYGAILGIGDSFDYLCDPYWKLQILRNYYQGVEPFAQHMPHPTRGWTLRPSVAIEIQGVIQSTNSRGIRSTTEYEPDPAKFVVMVLGDSFTFGFELGDSDAWPALLQGLDARLQVLNFGVCGYGTDQMLITLRESIEEYQPDAILFAPTTEDFFRVLLSYREYRKPRFVLDGQGRLQLTNTPIGDMEDTIAELRRQYPQWNVRKALAAENEQAVKYHRSEAYFAEWIALNRAILEEAADTATKAGADFLPVHLASCLELDPVEGRPAESRAEELMIEMAKARGLHVLVTREAFLGAGRKWTDGHYGRDEGKFVAGLVYETLKRLPTWKRFSGEDTQ